MSDKGGSPAYLMGNAACLEGSQAHVFLTSFFQKPHGETSPDPQQPRAVSTKDVQSGYSRRVRIFKFFFSVYFSLNEDDLAAIRRVKTGGDRPAVLLHNNSGTFPLRAKGNKQTKKPLLTLGGERNCFVLRQHSRPRCSWNWDKY